jgi:hypothetical protein
MEFSMPTFNVHLYREMRLYFPGIEADTPEKAAKLVAGKPTDEATTIDDCDGESHAALVDLVGDTNYSQSVTIDLDPGKGAAPSLEVTLLTVKEWLETGKVDGISRSNASIIEEIDAVIDYGKAALPQHHTTITS